MFKVARTFSVLLAVGVCANAFAAVPTATTNSASSVTATTAVLNGNANPNGESTTGWFRLHTTSPGTCNDTFGTRVPGTGGTGVGNGTAGVAYTVSTTGLLPGTTYFYCAVVQNLSGTAFGMVLSFSTPAQAPAISTTSATSVTSSSATLEGTANASGSAGTAYFRYGTSNPGSCSSTYGTRAPAGTGGTAISGNLTTNYAENITGLLAGVTYYYCAVGTNGVGTTFGNVLSFTTLVAAPVVTTTGASGLSGSQATLSGSANPNGASTAGWFRISVSDPGGCNDAFGTRIPAGPGYALGAGSSPRSYSDYATGLTPGTTYYYCAIAQNSVGTSFGTVVTFVTPNVPTVTSIAATVVTSTSAQLNGSVNPNGAPATAYFRYSPTNPGTCDDLFGTRFPSSSGAYIPSTNTYQYSVSSLLPGTTYYFCAIAYNIVGTSFGSLLTFTTPAMVPLTLTNSASLVTGTSATLNGQTNPRGAATTGWFRYSAISPGTCNDTFGTRAPVGTGGTAVGSGNSYQTFAEPLVGLVPGTTYYYCAIAQNGIGYGFGGLNTFVTPDVPTVTTTPATYVGGIDAQLNGTVNPNGALTTAWFRYATTNPNSCNDSFGTRFTTAGTNMGSGTLTRNLNNYISTLTPGTTYFYCAIASNSVGISFGTILSFTTPNVPTVTTQPVTLLTATSVTLNGTATPNGAQAYGWFRYSTVDPVTCSDTSSMSRAPTSGSISLNAGNSPVNYPQPLGGLLPGTTYYYCAIANNSVGTSVGAVITFTTPPTAPIVTTQSYATLITGTTATLSGTVNSRGAAATGWFRYSATQPASCNDSFGVRAPATGGTSFPGGNTTNGYSEALTGLSNGTTYYYCAIASNSVGVSFGVVYSFTTPAIPTVTTNAPFVYDNGVTAQLNGYVTPNLASTTAWFRYSTVNPGTCNDTFGTRHPLSGGWNAGTTAQSYYYVVSGFTPGTTYYYCAIASNSVGVGSGTVQTFTTPDFPTVTTAAASTVTATSAFLNGTAIPNRSNTLGWVRYGTIDPGTCTDTFGTRLPQNAGTGTTLGAGTSAVPFTFQPTNLFPGTTYFFCAIADNGVGTSYGAVLSFTTPPLAPTIVTSTTTSVTSNTATLNGQTNPRGAATTAWFRFSATSPGATCNDSFGTRVPAVGGFAAGANNTTVNYNEALTGLTLATTYYYCAIASNSVGTTFGSVLQFTTLPEPPSVTTLAATAVTTSAGTMNGTATPNGAATTAWIRFNTTSPVTCNDTFGTRIPATGGTALGSGVSTVGYSYTPTTLSPGVTYYYCAIANNSAGKSFGAVLSFTTVSTPPSINTLAATSVTGTTATLNGSVNANGDPTTAYFRYSTLTPGSCNDTFGIRSPATGGTAITGATATSYSQALSGLTTGTTYYFCAIATNSVGAAMGNLLSFTTPAAPTVTTGAASPVTATTATLNASGAGNGSAATGWFRYSLTDPGSCNDSFGTRIPATGGTPLGSTATPTNFAQPLNGLAPGTSYFFCPIASNAVGVSFGSVFSFTTPAAQPTVTTSAATGITSTTATLPGTSNPNGATATGWFRYNTTNPGACNDTFGIRAPATGGVALGTGTSAQIYSQAVTGLSPNTTYYFCALSSNAVGTSSGSVLSFTTPGAPTTVTTAATLITPTTAQLNGTSDANLESTTAWFRYSATNPTTCDDTFGTRAPLTGGAPIGAGTNALAYNQPLTGLTNGTTYFFCAISENAVGKTFGAVLQFSTPNTPTVITNAATVTGSSTATLSGSANPNGLTTGGWFRYGTVNPGTCNDTFSTTRAPAGNVALGAGTTSQPYSANITGLFSGTTYYYCAIASNAQGSSFGTVQQFTTNGAPTTVTNAATAVTTSTATLNGTATPNGTTTTGYFIYRTAFTSSCSTAMTGTRAPSTGGTTITAGSAATPFSQNISLLTQATTYYFCAFASNATGTRVGAVQTFTTPAAPLVTTSSATTVTATSATLNGLANPRGDTTTGWFRYSTTNPTSCNDTFGTRAPTTGGTSLGAAFANVAYSEALTGLTLNTTYYFCAIAANANGTSFGAVRQLTTNGAPVVTTTAATFLGSTFADLNGTVNPRGATANTWFRYSATNPTTCDDLFGTRTAVIDDQTFSGTSPVAYAVSIGGLTGSTTYYYCAIAENALGKSFGNVMSFTTLAPPTVTTTAATSVTSASAALNATANPNGLTSTGWFRWYTSSPTSCVDTGGFRLPTTSGTALGAGSIPVAYTRSLTGLAAGTIYYYCAFASNSMGTSAGTVQSFTTLQLPTVTTNASTLVTASSATLNGAANPRGDATTGYFRYSDANTGSCATLSTATPTNALGSGATDAPFSQALTGLTPATTYYYCAVATNSVGSVFGAVLTFTTPNVPTVTSVAASNVTGASATLNGSANPNGDASVAWFRYSTTDPRNCNDTFGIRAPVSSGTSLGAGTTFSSYSENLTGLTTGTTYYFCAIAQNTFGTAFGTVQSFTTPGAPVVTTSAASNLTGTTAALNGSANPTGGATTGYFRYAATNPTACNDTFGTRLPSSGGTSLGSGNTTQTFSQTISGLTNGTTYYFCAIAVNSVGTRFGSLLTFTTLQSPTTVTSPATSVTSTSATLNGSSNPNGAAATGWFRYSTTNPTTCTDTFGTRAPTTGGTSLGSGSTATPFSQTLTVLLPGTTYYYCAIASNSVGVTFGTVVSFSTPAAAPLVTTNSATTVTSGTATLNGSGTARGSPTTGYFRYAAANPGSCNDTFGTRAPTSAGTNLGTGNTAATFFNVLSGLTPATTYYFCAIAQNAVGTSFGTVLTFITPAAPLVTTSSASSVTSSSAVLNGVITPNSAATTGWFRYSLTNPGTCNDTFGIRQPGTGGTPAGSGTTPQGFSQPATNLVPGSTLFFCAIAANSVGISFGSVLSFNVTAPPPLVVTGPATDVVARSVTFNATANPNQTNTIGWFRYSTTPPTSCNDTFGTRVPAVEGMALGAGATATPYTLSVDGLTPSTPYYYCAVASNMGGASFGQVQTFTTPNAPPEVKTVGATVETNNVVTLKGSANPNGLEATAWFQYDTTNPGSCHEGFGTRSRLFQLGNGRESMNYSETLNTLTPGSYFYCAIAFTAAGTTYGEVLPFDVGGASAGGCGCSSGGAVSALGLLLLAGIFRARRRRSQVSV